MPYHLSLDLSRKDLATPLVHHQPYQKLPEYTENRAT